MVICFGVADKQFEFADKLLDASDLRQFERDLSLAVDCGRHENLLQLIGLCEEQDTIFVALEEGILTLKQVLSTLENCICFALCICIRFLRFC